MYFLFAFIYSKTFQAITKVIFQFFSKFLSDKVETIFWEGEAKHSKLFNQHLVIGSFLENGFEATLSSKTNVLRIWKEHFSFFCNFLSDKVETIFWESEANRSKLFKSKFGHRKLFRKCFWSYLELKNEFLVCLRRLFVANFWVTKLKPFTGKARQYCKNFFDKVYFVESFLESAFQSLFDYSRQSLLEFFNILNVLNVSIWIFNILV